MRRHPLDRPAPDDLATRARAFLRIEREKRASAASRTLQQQGREEGKGQALQQALRIARGRTV